MAKQTKHKTGLRKKVTFVICLVALIITLMGIGLGYFVGLRMLYAITGIDYSEIADSLANYIEDTVSREAEHIGAYSNSPLWKKQIVDSDLKYAGMDEKAMKQYFEKMDREWLSTPEDSPLIKEYLENYVGIRLRALAKDEKTIGEIFVTDKFGGLAASSMKTSDFYQADEEWWQRAYNGGKGKDYLGNIEFDESSKIWSLPIAVPIRDDSGEIIGIAKTAIDITLFFKALGEFDIGKTGHAALIAEDGRVIFHTGITPLSQNIGAKEKIQEFLKNKTRAGVFKKTSFYDQDQFMVFSKITSPLFRENGIRWYVLISQDAKEVFSPLHRLMLYLLLLMIILIVTMIPLGMFFGTLLIKPIEKLHKATEKVIAGDWDYKIEVHTNDETEQLADAFEEMINSIKNKQNELIKANAEIEDFSKGLEKKVTERTRDLLNTQEAMLNILEDLTDAKHKIEEALNIKSEFTSTVSHELRTPLAAIKEGIAIVLDGTAGDINAEQKEFLDIAKRNVDRLARLINDVLDFQKLEAGKMPFNITGNNINSLIIDVGKTMITLAEAKGLELVIDLEDNLPEIRFDRDKITQVLDNVVNNAIKFTDKGAITIATRRKDNVIEVSVRDTGAGIKEEDRTKLFTRFEQLGKGIDRKPGGTGLGLAISKEIVEIHKGKIWVESVSGQGSAFCFTLPINGQRG